MFILFACYFLAHNNPSYLQGARKAVPSSMKRKESKETASPGTTASGTPIASPQRSVRSDDDEEALVSERAAGHFDHSDSDNDERRVQFNKSHLKDSGNANDDDDEAKKKLKG